MKLSLAYDYETLSQDPVDGAIVSLAAIQFEEDRFLSNPYSYSELMDCTGMIKFDIKDQVQRFGRKIQKSALAWWKEQSEGAQKLIKPDPQNDKPLEDIYDFLVHRFGLGTAKLVYTRNNSFDPVFTHTIFKQIGKINPMPYYIVRDFKSTIMGLTWGHGIKDSFVPDDVKDVFVAHDPIHDVCMDVYRLQYLVRLINE